MDTHNQFGFKFYKGGMIPKHQNASGEELKEKNKSGIYYSANKEKDGDTVNLDELLEGYGDNHLFVGRNITYKPSGNDTIYYDLNGVADSFDFPEYKRIFENNLKKYITVPVTQSVIDNKDYVLKNFDEDYYNDWLKAHKKLQYLLDTSRINLRNGQSKNNVIQKQEGGEVKEKETPTSFYSSGYFIDENGNPVTQETEMVKGNYNGKQYNIQRNIINTNGKSDTIMYNNNKRIPLENPDSVALYNEIFRDLLMRAQPVDEYKKGGSLKKCSCGCKTLLKRSKGGKVMESKNCK